MKPNIFSHISLSPTSVAAGDSTEFVITIEAGPGYTSGKSRLIIDCPATLGMSRPSILHQEENGFLTARVSNPDATFSARVWDMEITDFPTRTRGSWRGMAARMGVVDISDGIRAGDRIEIRWGDAGGGFGPGTKVTTVIPRPDYTNDIHVRYFESWDEGLPDLGRDYAGYCRPVPICEKALHFHVTPREPRALRLIRTGRNALLAVHDRYSNIADTDRADTLIDTPEKATKNAFNLYVFENIHVSVKSRQLPLLDCPSMDEVFENNSIYWGDIHTHSAFSNDCIEREKMRMDPGDLTAFARDRAGLDFYSPTDHNEPHHEPRNHIGRDRWNHTLECAQKHNEPGRFLAFVGMEYRCHRGDTAVVFGGFPSWESVANPAFEDIRSLWRIFDACPYITIPHFHNGGGLDQNQWWENIDSRIETVLEMFSCHGSYERPEAFENGLPLMKSRRPDRYASWMLSKGYKYGLGCNSDSHKGHVGYNGVTAVYAKELTKEAILDAYRRRHVYGTTNARIRLLFTANGALMGSVLPLTEEKVFHLDIAGENTLKKVELFRNEELYSRIAPEGLCCTRDISVTDEGPSRWYVRVTQQDNQVAWSSPVWFE